MRVHHYRTTQYEDYTRAIVNTVNAVRSSPIQAAYLREGADQTQRGMGPSGLLPAPIRIVVVDRSAVFVAALRRFLDLEPGLEIVAHAFSSIEAITLVAQLRPDLVLTDMSIPEIGGLDLIRLLKRGASPPLVIVIAFFREYESRARESGADGFVSKAEVGSVLVPLVGDLLAARWPAGGR